MTELLTRRALLAVAPATGMAMMAPPSGAGVPSTPRADTPILRLFRQHQAIAAAAGEHVCAATGKVEDEDLERLFNRRSDRIEEEMMALPCTCAADFAAKVIVDTCKGGIFSDWETGTLWKEARSLTGSQEPPSGMAR